MKNPKLAKLHEATSAQDDTNLNFLGLFLDSEGKIIIDQDVINARELRKIVGTPSKRTALKSTAQEF